MCVVSRAAVAACADDAVRRTLSIDRNFVAETPGPQDPFGAQCRRSIARLPSARTQLVERQTGIEQRAKRSCPRSSREAVEVQHAGSPAVRNSSFEAAVPRVRQDHVIEHLDPHQLARAAPAGSSAPHHPRSAPDRRRDDCGTGRSPLRRRWLPPGTPRAAARCSQSSVPTDNTAVRSTRCLVSSRTTPNCSTPRVPYAEQQLRGIPRADDLRTLARGRAPACGGPASIAAISLRGARARRCPAIARRSSIAPWRSPCSPPADGQHRVGEFERARLAARRARGRSRAVRCRQAPPAPRRASFSRGRSCGRQIFISTS